MLFEKYSKMDIKKNHNIEGTGLGLTIAQELIEMMCRSIKAESIYGEGSVFTLEIVQKTIDNEPIGQDNAGGLANFTYKDNKGIQRGIEYISLEGRRALVVDDVQVNLYVTREMLYRYNLMVDCVESGQEAIDLIR